MSEMPEFDRASASVEARIKQGHNLQDYFNSNTCWKITRFENNKDLKQGITYEPDQAKDCFDGIPQESLIQGNVLLNEGINELLKLAATTGATQWSNTNAYLGTGTSSIAEQATDTGLLGTPVYKGMDATWPQVTPQTCTWQSTFTSDDANQAWNEFTVSNTATNAGINLNRKVSSQGTKQVGQSWQLQLAITFS